MLTRRTWLSLLGLSALSTRAYGAKLAGGFSASHQSEPQLLHKQLDAAQFRKLLAWDFRLSDWRQVLPSEPACDRGELIVLHLWADYCMPCREEFPILRELVEETEQKYGPRVGWVFLSETPSPTDMQVFLDKFRARMPKGPQYLDTGEGIANILRDGLSLSLSYPVTLILDSQRVVRHAFVGRILGRRAEFLTALERLLSIRR